MFTLQKSSKNNCNNYPLKIIIMKKITLLFIFFFALASYAQTKGITYQAVLLNPAGNQTRGVGQNLPLMDKQICM